MVRVIYAPNGWKRITSLFRKANRKNLFGFIAAFIILGGAATAFYLTQFNQDIRQQAETTSLNRITYLGKQWYLLGANVPWYNWACDFGCNTNGGVMGNKTALSAGFQKLKDAGMHNARWWVFPDTAWQIQRASDGTPTGLNPAIYADFDAALELAETHDLYYNFVLFSSTTTIPKSWITDPLQRKALADTLAPLFARYKNNPRVMTWEVFNEPEFQIWNNEIDQASVVATVKEIAGSVHQNSNSLVTVGGAMLDGLPMWFEADLDYYSPHWYDYMSSGGWCARCTDYSSLQNRFPGLNKPVVIGELYIGTDTDALARYNDFYNKGYAGAWPWSLFSNKTNDKLSIDFAAAKSFTTGKSDIGPSKSLITHSPTQTPLPTTVSSPTSTPKPTTGPTTVPTISPNSILSLSPATKTVVTGETFSVEVRVNTNSQTINGVEARINYPSGLLDVKTVAGNTDVFDVEAVNEVSNGIISLAYGATTPRSGSNLLVATVTFTAKSAGTASLTFSPDTLIASNISNTNVSKQATGGTYTILSPTPTPLPKRGDINGDGKVDVQDLSYLLSRWRGNDTQADLNRDGTVSTLDLSILLSNWGS